MTRFSGRTILVIIAVFLVGCGDTVIDPFVGTGRYFTVFGYLDFRETDHRVRVVPVRRTPELIAGPGDAQATIDATVFSTDLNTGSRVKWNHRLASLSDGTYGHVFEARFDVHQQHTYRLEVIRSDGATATAETTIPYIPDAALFERGPVEFSADSSVIYQDIHMPRIDSPWDMEVAYLWGAIGRNFRTDISYGRTGTRSADGGWDMRIEISRDRTPLRADMEETLRYYSLEEDAPVGVHSMGVRVHLLDSDWDPPAGVFDPEILAFPGTLSNVENGYGFFGSIGVYQQLWNVEDLSRSFGFDF